MAVSAHYITREWKVVCCVLETKLFPGSHTGIAISDRLLETVTEFKIENKVSAIVPTSSYLFVFYMTTKGMKALVVMHTNSSLP